MRFAFLAVLFCCLLPAQTFTPTPQGDALFNQQDWAGAAREFKLVTEQNPQDGRAWFRLAATLHRLEKFADSIAAFQRAADLQFQPPQAFAAIAREYAAEGDAAQALSWLAKAAKSGFGQAPFIESDPHLAALHTRPEYTAALETIRRNGKPCLSNPEYQQFDFWLGEWDVQVAGQTVARSRIEKVSEGCIVQENWMPFIGNEGKSWNYYEAATGKWEQLWISTGGITRYWGKLEGPRMVFQGTQAQVNGPTLQHRLSFTPLEGGRVRQLSEQSQDEGKTWTVGFDGIYVPRPKNP
ncbi:MAG TPA: hypothetical protein VG456_12690 [Candidatus Sulfopaludibacter sp.]|jgi:tetratricopeptide (TPR) repeat protein|nr:hypothetical protein [Candidatus Sulfopaludibacter sp.]